MIKESEGMMAVQRAAKVSRTSGKRKTGAAKKAKMPARLRPAAGSRVKAGTSARSVPKGRPKSKPKPRREAKFKGISRIDQPDNGTVGWFGRITHEGKRYSKYIADASNGGKRAALRKAVEWRNETERTLSRPRTDRQLFTPASGSRVRGVYRYKDHFIVAWSENPGVLLRELIPIKEYGVEGARLRAIRLRRQKERELYGQVIVATAVPKKRTSTRTFPGKEKSARSKRG